MKRIWIPAVLALLAVSIVVDVASAQGRRGGFGGRGFGGGQADTIADALVLSDARAEKVQAAVEGSAPGGPGGGFNREDFQNMSQEERMEAFQKMREERNKALLSSLSSVLSKEEIDFVKPVIESRGVRTVPEVRALRQIELDDATRAKLQTIVLIYMNTVASITPQGFGGPRGGGQGGPGAGGGRGRFGLSEEDQAKVEKAQTTMLADVKDTLSAEQNTAWDAKTKEVQAEMEARRAQRGQGGGFGGQRGGGQRGGGQRGGGQN